MISSAGEKENACASAVRVTKTTLVVDLLDGRSVSVPIVWYPRLLHGTSAEREGWRLIGGGEGIHWPDLDEDISIAGLLAGRASGESQRSLKKWIDARRSKPAGQQRPVPRPKAPRS